MAVMASYCQSYARWVEAEMAIEGEGTERSGEKADYVNPQVKISGQYHGQMLKAAAMLGLTAGGRSAVTKSNPNQTARVGDELDVDALLASVN